LFERKAGIAHDDVKLCGAAGEVGEAGLGQAGDVGIDFVEAEIVVRFSVGGEGTDPQADDADAAMILAGQGLHGEADTTGGSVISGGQKTFGGIDKLHAVERGTVLQSKTMKIGFIFIAFPEGQDAEEVALVQNGASVDLAAAAFKEDGGECGQQNQADPYFTAPGMASKSRILFEEEEYQATGQQTQVKFEIGFENEGSNDGDQDTARSAAGSDHEIIASKAGGVGAEAEEFTMTDHTAGEQSGGVDSNLNQGGESFSIEPDDADGHEADEEESDPEGSKVVFFAVKTDHEGKQVAGERKNPEEGDGGNVQTDFVGDGEEFDGGNGG
jgi:hypothetical protein